MFDLFLRTRERAYRTLRSRHLPLDLLRRPEALDWQHWTVRGALLELHDLCMIYDPSWDTPLV